MPIPEYIERRIRRLKPADAHVVEGSTPVVSFGDARKARVATLGLNPSRREFDPIARLAMSGSSPEQVLEDCNTYFRRRPYIEWFGKLGPCLTAFDASYSNGSACHLDLVQWATDPTWDGLDAPIRRRLIAEDAAFLESQLRSNENLDLLLVNGSGAWKQLCRRLGVENIQVADILIDLSYHPTRLFSGCLFGRVKILAWSTNLQSSHGVKAFLWEAALPEHLKQIHERRWG